MENSVEQEVWQWLDNVVIGLNLCPFAKKPRANNQIRLCVSESRKNKTLLGEFEQELVRLQQTSPDDKDTSLFIVSNHLYDFYDYLDFLDAAQLKLENLELEGVFQLASFHPDYVFEGTQPEDRENLTNRAPYPIIHIIREDSMAKVLEKFPNPESIPEINIKTIENLNEVEIKELFPHLV